VFEATLSHGTTFRNEISMLKDKVERLRVKDDDMVLIMFINHSINLGIY
jgi:hypothetical protein